MAALCPLDVIKNKIEAFMTSNTHLTLYKNNG